MEARRLIAALGAVTLLAVTPLVAAGASARSQNFIVSAQSRALAEEICRAAEDYRRDLAIEWLGDELPPWSQPCPIEAQVHSQLGAGGATQFSFSRQSVPFGWSMTIQGSKERVLDSVLPHEITHTIFATHFGRPLPRWADEGACTTVEHVSEKRKQEKFLIDFLLTERGIPFNKMFAMKEYPPDMLPLYAQGYSLARYMIMQGGKRKFVQYVGEGMQTENWPAVTRKYYGHKDLSDLQVTWLAWVQGGSPKLQPIERPEGRSDVMLAQDNSQAVNSPATLAASPLIGSPSAAPQNLAPQAQIPDHALMARTKHTPASNQPPAYAKNLETVAPPRPEFNGNSQSVAATRPYSEGWYQRRRDEVNATARPITPPAEPAPIQAVPAGSLTNPPATAPTSATPPNDRRVMLEWTRPTDQPWTPGSIPNPALANEILARRDLTAASGSNWR